MQQASTKTKRFPPSESINIFFLCFFCLYERITFVFDYKVVGDLFLMQVSITRHVMYC